MNEEDLGLLQFLAVCIDLEITDLICEKLPEETMKKYTILKRKRDLYQQGAVAGWDVFDWNKAHELGWLCVNDYSVFPELRNFSPSTF